MLNRLKSIPDISARLLNKTTVSLRASFPFWGDIVEMENLLDGSLLETLLQILITLL